MNVKLIAYTPEPEKIVAAAAKLCYSSKVDIDSLMESLTPENTESFVRKLAEMGHDSPAEHASYVFAIEGVSRVLTHELASYSQRSQRYVGEGKFEYVIPPTIIKAGKEEEYCATIEKCRELYENMVAAGIPKEDARYILPNATNTRIIATFNTRSLKNFFERRCCTRAQWEIRELAFAMLKEVKKIAPNLFAKAGPACCKGFCPEGKMSCGKAPTLDKLIEAYNAE